MNLLVTFGPFISAWCFLIETGLFIYGLIALITGTFSLSRKLTVTGFPARVIGMIAMVPIPLAILSGIVIVVLGGVQSDGRGGWSVPPVIILVELGILLLSLAVVVMLVRNNADCPELPIGQNRIKVPPTSRIRTADVGIRRAGDVPAVESIDDDLDERDSAESESERSSNHLVWVFLAAGVFLICIFLGGGAALLFALGAFSRTPEKKFAVDIPQAKVLIDPNPKKFVQNNPPHVPFEKKGQPPQKKPSLPKGEIGFEAPDPPTDVPAELDARLRQPAAKIFLSDLNEFAYKNPPFEWTFGKNGKLNGTKGDILIKGQTPPKGLSTHPPYQGYTRVCYALGGLANTLHGSVAISEGEQRAKPGPLRFLVLGDGKKLWRSNVIAAQGQQEEFSIDVRDINVLELRVHSETGNVFASHAVWIDPYVTTKEK